MIRLADPRPEHHRRVFEGLRAAGIGVQVHYTPVHLQPYYRKLGFREGNLSSSRGLCQQCDQSSPLPRVAAKDQQRVAEALATLLRP